MEQKNRRRRAASLAVWLISFSLVLDVTFRCSLAASGQFSAVKKSSRFGSSLVLPLAGNVYPLGYYSVSIGIGNPPKQFELDIDTGSDLTWVQCDAPCTGCTKPVDHLYKPKNNLVPCEDPRCGAIQSTEIHRCESANDQCDYEVQYADEGSSLGVLVVDNFPLKLMNGSLLKPPIVFGCGYDQKNAGPISPPPTSGVLGLGNGKTSIVSQLKSLGVMKNVIGHCLSRKGGGYLSFGDDVVPSSGVTWAPMVLDSLHQLYTLGPAELVFDGKVTGLSDLFLIFDSGSSYSYFAKKAYETALDMIKKDLSGSPLKDAPEEKALSVCWKGKERFKSVRDVKGYFKPLSMSFCNVNNCQLQIPPEDYLVVTKDGNVCLGILNGTEVGLGNFNIIGDIFLQDKMVIYDNEKNRIGWASANCDRLPNSFLDSSDQGTYKGILGDQCSLYSVSFTNSLIDSGYTTT